MKIISLSILVFAPLLMSIILANPLFPNNEVKIRRFSKGFAIILFLYSLMFLITQNPTISGYQFVESVKWIQPLGINFSLGIDGISITLVILTTFLVLLACIASKSSINKKHKTYYSLLFLLTTAILGVFTAKDLFLFFLFWELELIPMYFLISMWGSGRKEYSAMKFVLYTFLGSIFMLAAILSLHFYHLQQTGVSTFDIDTFITQKAYFYPISLQILLFLGFFIAFAVKMPVVPFHTWLPDAHVDAPTPVSMLLAGILLKMGAYGFIRMNIQMFPDAMKYFAQLIIILGVINIIYAALIALVQKDLKKLIAYSSVSHMGIVLLGFGAANVAGISGAIFQMFAHGVISAGLFMIVGVIYLRTHTRLIPELGGLAQAAPRMFHLSLVIILASLGLPLLIGFSAETLVFYSLFTSSLPLYHEFIPICVHYLAGIGIFGIVLTAAYLLWMTQKVFFGTMFSKWKRFQDITPHEFIVLFSLIAVIFLFGVYPSSLVKLFEPTVKSFIGYM